MYRSVVILLLILMAHAGVARAQSPVYVGGDVFVDVQRASGQTAPTRTSLDATVAGGGVRVGAFLASRWTLELGVDATAATDTDVTVRSDSVASATGASLSFSSVVPIGISAPLIPPIFLTLDQRVRTRVTATTVLVGYHPPARGRLKAGFKGGMSFVRSSSTLVATTTYTISDPRFAPSLILPAPSSTTVSSVAFGTAATAAAELAVALTSHASLVPEVRVLGFGGRLFVRPGAEL